ncbi:MAG: bifunctional 4-hydroxy-2-oxoglutarate aldolase/2-dehydro-3-deoxy-phosphogluconate aldolase [Lautropia sp.]
MTTPPTDARAAPATPAQWLAFPIVPVVVVDEVDSALFIADALLEAGLPCIEVTLRSPIALQAIERIAAACPTMTIAAGTVLAPAQVRDVANAGATLCVSPGFTRTLDDAMKAAGMPWIPGVATASEVMRACEAGYSLLKFFPAAAAGGPAALGAIAAAIRPALGGRPDFIPTGGVNVGNLPAWKALGCVAGVGGSWLTPAASVLARDRAAIVTATRDALMAWHRAPG